MCRVGRVLGSHVCSKPGTRRFMSVTVPLRHDAACPFGMMPCRSGAARSLITVSRCCEASADNRNKGSDNRHKGAENRNTGTDNRHKAADNRNKVLIITVRVPIIKIQALHRRLTLSREERKVFDFMDKLENKLDHDIAAAIAVQRGFRSVRPRARYRCIRVLKA